ncbi:MAG TPA: chloride channel protein [Rhodothermales bacterium]
MKPQRPFRYIKTNYLRTLRLLDRNFEWEITGRWMFYSVLIGVAGAFAALAFSQLLELVSNFALFDLTGYQPPAEDPSEAKGFDLERSLNPTRRWLLLVVPAVGGLISGWLVYKFAPEAEGHGTDAVIKAFHRGHGIIRPRVAVVKALASSVTIGTGGSAGREGPIAQIAATIGSNMATKLKLSDQDRREFLVAGVAAGVGSIFKSPLGGAFFAVEVLYRDDIETRSIMPATIAAITGYSIYSSLVGSSTVFTTPGFEFINPVELVPLTVFALTCAVVGIFYTNVFYATREKLFDRITVPPHLKPAIGGLVVGGIAFLFPAVLGSSYSWLQQAIDGNLPVVIMATLLFTKIVATSFTIGSGGSGGVFAPSLVIGGMLGGIFGEGMHRLAPELVTQPEMYVMIGMATFFTGVANVPISTTIMISEMTGSYKLLVPLIFSGVIVHLLSRRWSLYKQQVRSHNESPAYQMEVAPDVLADIPVKNVVKYPVYYHQLDPDHSLADIVSVFTRTTEIILPVVVSDEQGERIRYSGLVLLDNIQPLLGSDDEAHVTADSLQVPFVSVTLDDTLDGVLTIFEETKYPELPVLDESGTIVGFIRPSMIVGAYHRASLKRKAAF